MLHAAVLWVSGPLIMEIGKHYGILGVMVLLMSICFNASVAESFSPYRGWLQDLW